MYKYSSNCINSRCSLQLLRLGTCGITPSPPFINGEVVFLLDEAEGNGSKLSEVHVKGDLANMFAIPRLTADGDWSLRALQLEVYPSMKTFVATATRLTVYFSCSKFVK